MTNDSGSRLIFRSPSDKSLPAYFFLHKSVHNSLGIITGVIESHGGEVTETEELADIVIVNGTELVMQRNRYALHPDLHKRSLKVYDKDWLRRCVKFRQYLYDEGEKPRGMPGSTRRGEFRTTFTSQDDDNLAFYLAHKLPYLKDGGRLGSSIYNVLMTMGEKDPDYAWTKRHTAQSWRERYKMRQDAFNQKIDALIRSGQVNLESEARDHRSRNLRHIRLPPMKRTKIAHHPNVNSGTDADLDDFSGRSPKLSDEEMLDHHDGVGGMDGKMDFVNPPQPGILERHLTRTGGSHHHSPGDNSTSSRVHRRLESTTENSLNSVVGSLGAISSTSVPSVKRKREVPTREEEEESSSSDAVEIVHVSRDAETPYRIPTSSRVRRSGGGRAGKGLGESSRHAGQRNAEDLADEQEFKDSDQMNDVHSDSELEVMEHLTPRRPRHRSRGLGSHTIPSKFDRRHSSNSERHRPSKLNSTRPRRAPSPEFGSSSISSHSDHDASLAHRRKTDPREERGDGHPSEYDHVGEDDEDRAPSAFSHSRTSSRSPPPHARPSLASGSSSGVVPRARPKRTRPNVNGAQSKPRSPVPPIPRPGLNTSLMPSSPRSPSRRRRLVSQNNRKSATLSASDGEGGGSFMNKSQSPGFPRRLSSHFFLHDGLETDLSAYSHAGSLFSSEDEA